MSNHHDLVNEAARAAPALTVGGLTLFGVALSDWVLLTTLVYTVLQLYFLLRDKWYLPRKARNGRK
jgi:hypothetical protein